MAFARKATKKRKRSRGKTGVPRKRKRRMSKAAKAAFVKRMAKARATCKPRRKASKKRRKRSLGHTADILDILQGARVSAPKQYKYKSASKKRRRKSSHIVLSENPIHFPKTARGRPSKVRFWLLDVYKGSKITSYIGRSDKTTAERDAMRKLVRTGADRVALNGPYLKRPHMDSVRK